MAVGMLSNDEKGKRRIMKMVLIQCQCSGSYVDLAFAFGSVCAAGIVDDRFELRGGFTRSSLHRNDVFSEVAQAVLRGARSRTKIKWQQTTWSDSNSAFKKGNHSIIAR